MTYIRENLPVDDEDIATPNKIKDCKYLLRIANKISQGKDISIGTLIDGNCSKVLEPLEVMPSKDSGFYAFRTLLALCIVGRIGDSAPSTAVACNRISVQDKATKIVSHYFAIK